MQIDIQARQFSLTDALRNHAERRQRDTARASGLHDTVSIAE